MTGSPGQAIPDMEVKIKDGEIIASGRNIMQGYYNRPKETSDIIRNGWLYTGDLGYINKETPPVGQNAPKTLEEIDHKIISAFMFNCDGCGECVNVCPKNALTLITPEPAAPRARYSRDGTIVICGTLANGKKKFPLNIRFVFLAFRFLRFLQRRGIRMKGLVADL